ncbi:MAG: reverse transcriptase/maturase family protein [Bryobacterales bacterium]|nr:reverse transcriptase/maturase family protein [Bryobacterales bacterium]
MKTHKHLYPQVYNFENLLIAYYKARKGKRGKGQVAGFERKFEEQLFVLQKELRAKTYTPGEYASFYVHEPKKRLISAAPFRDRVVHHALCNVITPIWEPRFIETSYANRVGKGTHRALAKTAEYARKYRWFLQCDVKQFFPSIDHEILRAELARLIADKDVLWLCGKILESGVGVLSEQYDMVYFPGDEIFAVNRPRGLPIGNLTSQFLANVYLNSLDQFVKRELKCEAYLRYVDDFILFDDDLEKLYAWRADIFQKTASLRLTLHEDSALVFPTQSGIPFLGFRSFPDHRRVKSRKVIAFRHRLKETVSGNFTYASLASSIRGWINHVRYGDTHGLVRSMLRFNVPQAAL